MLYLRTINRQDAECAKQGNKTFLTTDGADFADWNQPPRGKIELPSVYALRAFLRPNALYPGHL